MKKLLLFSFLLLLFSCASNYESEKTNDILGESKYPGMTPMPGTIDGVDGVSTWKKESEILLNDYYSIIDTTINRIISRDILYYDKDGANTSVDWFVNDIKQNDYKVSKTWDGDAQKWKVTNTVKLDISGITNNLAIKAVVNYTNGIVVRFKAVPKITITKHTSDIFGYTFNTNRTDMGSFVSYDYSPYLSRTNMGDSVSFLGFTNGKLSDLYIISDHLSNMAILRRIYVYCKMPSNIEFTSTADTIKPQTWSFNRLNFKIYNADSIKGIEIGNNLTCLSITKQ
jgi:hypothetical protein